MLTLLDTAIGFIVVLLMISLVIKGITSMIKNFVDYKRRLVSQQLKKALPRLDEQIDGWRDAFNELVREGKVSVAALEPRLVRGLAGAIAAPGASGEWKKQSAAEDKPNTASSEQAPSKAPAAKPRLGADYLLPAIEALDERVGTVVSTTNKNLSMAIGLTVCLLFNINCLSVWKTLYNDANLRALLSSPKMTDGLTPGGGGKEDKPPAAPTGAKGSPQTSASNSDQDRPTTLAELQAQLFNRMDNLKDAVPFAFGRIWSSDHRVKDWKGTFHEFFGSLLTGLLASVGAPYLHDMLRILTAIRRRNESQGKSPGDQPARA